MGLQPLQGGGWFGDSRARRRGGSGSGRAQVLHYCYVIAAVAQVRAAVEASDRRIKNNQEKVFKTEKWFRLNHLHPLCAVRRSIKVFGC